MAKQDALINGRIGNVIFYRWKGIGCARIASRRMRQTKATKQSAKDFGRAVQLSRSLRSLLSPAVPNYKDREVMYKINSAMLDWLRQESPMEENISFVGLELNEKSAFTSRFRKDLLVDFDKKGKIVIAVPRLKIPDDIVAPSNTSSIRLDIAAASCMLSEFQNTGQASLSIEIPYKEGWVPEIKEEMKFNCKPGTINVVAVSLHYITKTKGVVKEVVDDRWTPASIIAGLTG